MTVLNVFNLISVLSLFFGIASFIIGVFSFMSFRSIKFRSNEVSILTLGAINNISKSIPT